MIFYKGCLGGELTFQTIGESPLSAKMPKRMKNCIVHATLSKEALLLMASDMVSEQGLIKGNSVLLSLNCSSEEEIKDCYAKLSAGGTASHPLEENFWGVLFGSLTDKFGNHWVLNYNKNANG
ncbi:VOC family protein [Niabella aquatica]